MRWRFLEDAGFFALRALGKRPGTIMSDLKPRLSHFCNNEQQQHNDKKYAKSFTFTYVEGRTYLFEQIRLCRAYLFKLNGMSIKSPS